MPSGRLCPACRNTLLSRYNPDPLCAACTRAAQAPPQEELGAPTWLWDSSPWRHALAQMDLATALAVFRAASGLFQHQLAEITGAATRRRRTPAGTARSGSPISRRPGSPAPD